MPRTPPALRRYLTEDEAAAYLAVSAPVFRDEVRRGLWPRPLRRDGRPMWDRAALDARADALSGLDRGAAVTGDAAARAAEEAWLRAIDNA